MPATFQPHRALRNPHLQTIFPALMRRPPALARRRQRLPTWDGDFLDLDWFAESQPRLAILLHGLAGSSQSGYMLGLQAVLAQHGWGSVAINFRGCSGQPNWLARCYHSGETEDIDFVYRHLRQTLPDTPLAVIGFSLGGNVLLKWLGEQGSAVQLSAAVAVSVPLVLSECANRLDRGLSRVYRHYLLNGLKHYLRGKQQFLHHHNPAQAERIAQLGDLRPIRSFWQYDDRVVAPLHGFKDVHDYYQKSSSRQYLSSITTRSLIIQAEDDPFMTANVLPHAHELSPSVTLDVHPNGGHVGFVSGAGSQLEYWLERRIVGFLNNHDC